MGADVSIVNYGVGNIQSLKNALASIGYSVAVISTPEEILSSNRLILPGVGAFPHAMDKLKALFLSEALVEYAQKGNPLLGICLGMQVLFKESQEFGLSKGLGLVNGGLEKFNIFADYPVPQIQWNDVTCNWESKLLSGVEGELFYFLHSFYVRLDPNNVYDIGTTNYSGIDYVSLVECGNIAGVQFHPEKSGAVGLKLLNNFIKDF